VLKGCLAGGPRGSKSNRNLSAYYLALEIAQTYDGMMVAIPSPHWSIFRSMNAQQLADVFARAGGTCQPATVQENIRAVPRRSQRHERHTKTVVTSPLRKSWPRKSNPIYTLEGLAIRVTTVSVVACDALLSIPPVTSLTTWRQVAFLQATDNVSRPLSCRLQREQGDAGVTAKLR